MRPIYVYKTGTGTSNSVQISRELTPANLGLAVYTNGTVNYTVQYTYDDISGTYPNALPTVFNAPVWFNHPVLTNQTGNLDSQVTTPISAVQIVVNSGAGTAMLVVVQAGRGQ